jgi:hypothetical protein
MFCASPRAGVVRLPAATHRPSLRTRDHARRARHKLNLRPRHALIQRPKRCRTHSLTSLQKHRFSAFLWFCPSLSWQMAGFVRTQDNVNTKQGAFPHHHKRFDDSTVDKHSHIKLGHTRQHLKTRHIVFAPCSQFGVRLSRQARDTHET